MNSKNKWFEMWLWKVLITLILILIVMFIVFGIPNIIDYEYKLGNKLPQPNTHFSASDLLSYYGAVLSFFGTVALGGLALYQNQSHKKQADDLMDLQFKPYINIFNTTGSSQSSVPRISITSDSFSNRSLRLQNIGTTNILDIKCVKYSINGNEINIRKPNEDSTHYIAANAIHIIEMPTIDAPEEIIHITFNIWNAVGSKYEVYYEFLIKKDGKSLLSGKILSAKKLTESI